MQIKNHNKYIKIWKTTVFQDIALQEKDRFFLWIPFLLAIGIAVYFGSTNEPPFWMGLTCLFISGVTTYYLRSYYIVFLTTLIITIVFAGFSSAQLRTIYLDTHVLIKDFGPAGIQGRIVKIQETEKGMKITLSHLQVARMRADLVPTMARLHLNTKKPIIKVGDWIETRGILKPVPAPAAPGSFDFQRHSYFQNIGAIGFIFGEIHILNKNDPQSQSITGFIDDFRKQIEHRINYVFKDQPDIRAIGIAFLTGNKQTINEVTHEKVRASGLAHLLAISGLHIGLVASIIFFSLRFICAHIPYIALNFPIKKGAAVCAIMAALFFTLLTGASIPTIRAFIMTSIVLTGVLLDRKAISLRSVAWAAIIILLLYPESLLGPSFQLSFAAVTGLVAFYERRKIISSQSKTIDYFKDVLSSSFIASTATMPFAAYHFNRIALYGIGANLLAVPLTVFWIMPFGLIALILMPFSLDEYSLTIMGWGISILLWIADTTAQLPYAQLSISAFSNETLAFFTVGGLSLCLFTKKMKYVAILPISLACIFAIINPKPNILITPDGKLNAIRSEEGRILVSNQRHASFIKTAWVKRWGEENQPTEKFQKQLPCDPAGCSYEHASGIQVIFNTDPMALNEDCQKADLLITPSSNPMICSKPKIIIDHVSLQSGGAQAIYFEDNKIKVVSDKDIRGTRPWTVYGE
jgi:competence protein ComEC